MMDARDETRNVNRARIVSAMAHPTRLFLAEELARRGSQCVCELTALIGADMSTVSRHLTILRDAGIVDHRKLGSQVFYELTPCARAGFLDSVDALVRETSHRDPL